MVHVKALPGTPMYKGSFSQITDAALSDAMLLENGGVDAIMIENMHDRPYLNKNVGPEIIASMTAVAVTLKNYLSVPLGIQILAGANRASLASALVAGFNFIRAEGFVFCHLSDEGIMNSDAVELLWYRKQDGAEHISIFTDIKKKHSSQAVSADVSIEEMAKAASFFLSDGIVVTGNATGEETSVADVEIVKKSTRLPVIIGSGIDKYNVHKFWEFADGFIVGSSLKRNGNWENEVDPENVKQFMHKIYQLRNK